MQRASDLVREIERLIELYGDAEILLRDKSGRFRSINFLDVQKEPGYGANIFVLAHSPKPVTQYHNPRMLKDES